MSEILKREWFADAPGANGGSLWSTCPKAFLEEVGFAFHRWRIDRLWGCSKLQGIPEVPGLDLCNTLSLRQTPTQVDSWRHSGAQTQLYAYFLSSSQPDLSENPYSLKEGEKKWTQGLRTLGRRGCVSPGRLYMHIWFCHFMLLRFLWHRKSILDNPACFLVRAENRDGKWKVCLSQRLKHSDKIQNRTVWKVAELWLPGTWSP